MTQNCYSISEHTHGPIILREHSVYSSILMYCLQIYTLIDKWYLSEAECKYLLVKMIRNRDQHTLLEQSVLFKLLIIVLESILVIYNLISKDNSAHYAIIMLNVFRHLLC